MVKGQGLNVQHELPLAAAWERTAEGRKGGQEASRKRRPHSSCHSKGSSGDLETLELDWCGVFKVELS